MAEANQDTTFFRTGENSKMFNINVKSFRFFNYKSRASWVGDIARYYSSIMVELLSTFMRFQTTIISLLFKMIFGHLKAASSRQDNPETILRCLRNVLLKMYQCRCLQETFKKSYLYQRIWGQFLDVLKMS